MSFQNRIRKTDFSFKRNYSLYNFNIQITIKSRVKKKKIVKHLIPSNQKVHARITISFYSRILVIISLQNQRFHGLVQIKKNHASFRRRRKENRAKLSVGHEGLKKIVNTE